MTATAVTTASVTLPSTLGVPPAATAGVCVAPGAACTAPPLGVAPPAVVGETRATVTDLAPGTAASCYAVATNSQGAACSATVAVVTLAPPTSPTALALGPNPACTICRSRGRRRRTRACRPPPWACAAWLRVTATALNTSVALVAWSPTFPGIPPATYDAACVAQGAPCNAPADGTAAGATNATIAGLPPGAALTCYARASNAATPSPVCSVGVDVQLWTPAAAPTGLTLTAVNTTALALAWTLPSPPGVPRAATGAICVASGLPCTAPPIGVAPAVGATLATVTSLSPRTALSCYALATNAVGSACSPPLAVTTWGAPGPATDVAAAPLTTTSVTVSWGAAEPEGLPSPTTYQPLCVAAGAPCTAPPVATGAPGTTAPGSSTVGGPSMVAGGSYSCYVLTSNAASATPAAVTTYTLPGPLSAPIVTSINGTSISASWNSTLTPGGTPVPALGLTCVAGSTAA